LPLEVDWLEGEKLSGVCHGIVELVVAVEILSRRIGSVNVLGYPPNSNSCKVMFITMLNSMLTFDMDGWYASKEILI
jgi:hypothetical protein